MNTNNPKAPITEPKQKSSQQRLLILCALIILLMFGVGYALVPLYNTFCKVTGYNGKITERSALSTGKIDTSRTITIEFLAENNVNLPNWKFFPLVKKITVHPSENKRVAFFTENDSPNRMTVQAIPSITPGEAAKYFRKTECFCFTRQTLNAGQALDMPMIFHLDPALPKYIKVITLSYTMFDVTAMTAAKRKVKTGYLP